jgi:hypothetical protein
MYRDGYRNMRQYNLVEMAKKTLGPLNFLLKASCGIHEMEHLDIICDFLGKKNLKIIILCGHVGWNCIYL